MYRQGRSKCGQRWTRVMLAAVFAVAAATPLRAWAQESDDLGEEDDSVAKPSAGKESDSGPGQMPAEAPSKEKSSGEDLPRTPPAPVPPPAAPPSPFTFMFKGMLSGTMYMQDAAFLYGNGQAAIAGAQPGSVDKWFLGGDVRQAALSFIVMGPKVLGGATPTGVVEFDLFGGNQLTSIPSTLLTVPVLDGMNNPTGQKVKVPGYTTSGQGLESILPALFVAYIDLNWGLGQDVLRVGQYHSLMLAMIPASGSHNAVPLGYGAGQLGFHYPGITYLHRFMLSSSTSLNVGLQVATNSWAENTPQCGMGENPPATDCLPQGIDLGKASALPQVEARLLLSGPPAESPWPMYPPNMWQIYAVGHWDQKDLSGIQSTAVLPARDTMQTVVGEFGAKLNLGRLLVAGNGWYGKNSGALFGNLFQMQAPNAPDVSGFGAWGQIGAGLTHKLWLWFFAGMDEPNQQEAKNAGFKLLKNSQLSAMASWKEGPLTISLEWLHITTDYYVPPFAPTLPALIATMSGNQFAATMGYTF